MDQDKLIKLQMQMKQNNEDYKDFIDGIESWSTEIKEKEQKKLPIEKINTFPIRNSVIKMKKNKKVKNKISAYDYKAWDKFDVEKALEDDEENQEKISDDDIEKDSLEEMKILSREHREVGNLRFKENNFVEACAEYTKAILYDSGNSVLYANRAMSLINMGSYEAAETDCCKAIELDYTSVKAFYRRSKCRCKLLRKEEALEDLKVVLQLDPLNKIAKKECVKLENELNIRGVVEPIFGGPKKDKQSSKPSVRININDVNPSKSISEVIESQSLDFNFKEKVDQSIRISLNGDIPNNVIENTEIPSFSEPISAVQLIKDVNKYRRIPLHRAKYISNIDYHNYRKLIGHSLDCKLLRDFIDGLSYSLNVKIISSEQFVNNINALTEVARFSSLWLMMSEDEKVDFNAAIASLDEKCCSSLNLF